MALQCEINLHKEPEHVFVPGETVSGDIKYRLCENSTFTKITVSLKGKDLFTVDGTIQTNKCFDNVGKHYVDINNIVHEDENGATLPAGTFEIPFSMTLPYDIPGSLNHKKSRGGYCMNYKIFYYVRIQFERPGFIKQCKSFKKTINVTSSIIPTLPIIPVTYEEKKKLARLFTRREDTVTIKATVENSVVESGGRVQLKCELENDTKFKIKLVEVKLVEIFNMKACDITEEVCDVLQSARLKPLLTNRGDTETIKLVLDIPKEASTVRKSKLISRNYFVLITVILPAFYKNVCLKVPLEVGKNTVDCVVVRDRPPMYCDALNLLQHDEIKVHNFDEPKCVIKLSA